MHDKPEELAFPTGNPTYGGHSGMTLLDYFAGQALMGMLADSTHKGTIPKKYDDEPLGSVTSWFAYGFADAMLKEREKRNA